MPRNIEDSRAQFVEEQRTPENELAQLNRIAIALTSEFDLQRLLQMITDAARRVTAAHICRFFSHT